MTRWTARCTWWTSLLVTILAGTDFARGEDFPPEIVQFTPHPDNPVFAGTGRDTWDRAIRERGYILREGDTYHMWYTGYSGDRSDVEHLGYATSGDGLKWTRHPDNPIFDDFWVEDIQVVKHDDIYYMFAEGYPYYMTAEGHPKSRHLMPQLLTSKDRIHWRGHGDLDIRYTSGEPLRPAPYGTPTVWIEGSTWHLFYERNDEGIWLATSTDLKLWKNVQDDPVIPLGPEPYDEHLVAMDQIIKHQGKYYGYYHAHAKPDRRSRVGWTTCVAMSTDLVHWKKYPKNPIISGGNCSSGILVHDGSQFRLYTMHPDVRVYFHQETSRDQP